LCEQIGVDTVARERIWSGTAAAWLGSALPPAARAQPPAPPRREAEPDVALHGNTESGIGGWLGASPSMLRWCC
jgi:hypothetical protein